MADGKETGVKIAISKRGDGSLKKENLEIDHAKLLHFYKKIQFSGMPICMHQVHGNHVAVVENTREIVFADTDGLITNKKNVSLAVITADCLPIFLYDPKNQAVGAVHAGRRSLANGILQKAVDKMRETYNTDPKDIAVTIGPYIRTNCYEVGEDIASAFAKAFNKSAECIVNKEGKYFLSLKKAALLQLQALGVSLSKIDVSPICTHCDTNYYSYRRGDTNGRFVSLISLQ